MRTGLARPRQIDPVLLQRGRYHVSVVLAILGRYAGKPILLDPIFHWQTLTKALAWILLVCVKEIAWVRCIFETRFCQCEFYRTLAPLLSTTSSLLADLGRHSFALYLAHGPVIGLVSERLFYVTGMKFPSTEDDVSRFGHLANTWKDKPWWPLPEGGPYGLEPNFFVVVVLSLPVMLWVAEIGTKMWDEPGVKSSRWIWAKLKAL